MRQDTTVQGFDTAHPHCFRRNSLIFGRLQLFFQEREIALPTPHADMVELVW